MNKFIKLFLVLVVFSPIGVEAVNLIFLRFENGPDSNFSNVFVTGNYLNSQGVLTSITKKVTVAKPLSASVVKTTVVGQFMDEINEERSLTATPTPVVSIPTITVN